MNIVVIGDSLSLPRGHKSQSVTDTWPALLQHELGAYVWNRSLPSSTSDMILGNLKQLEFYCAHAHSKLDALLIQVGIVDATPREFSLAAQRMILALPKGKSAATSLARWLFKITRRTKRPWVSESDFSLNIAEIIQTGKKIGRVIAFVSIAPPRHHLLSNEPHLPLLVNAYNRAMQASISRAPHGIALFIDPWQDIAESQMDTFLFADGHHLSNDGHAHLAKCLAKKISQVPLA